MLKARHTRIIAAMIGAAGIAMSANAQNSQSTSTTTISSSSEDGSYEVKLKNGELVVVKVDGKKIDLDKCEHDKEGGCIVIDIDGEEPIVVDIPSMTGGGFNVQSPIAITRGNSFFPGQIGAVTTPEPIQWADAPDKPEAPAVAQSWSFGSDDEPRVMIGISHDEVNEELRERFELDKGEGIYVIKVHEGLPAAEAGIKAGDVIVEVDGEWIEEREVLREVLDDSDPGDKIRVVVIREDEDGDVIKKKLRLKLAEYNGYVLRGGEPQNVWTTRPEGNMRFHIQGDGEGFAFDRFMDLEDLAEFPDAPEIDFFREFDFELPEEIEDMEPEVREEIMRAIEMARDRANETRDRAIELRINREAQARELHEHARQLQEQARRHLHELELNEELHGEHLERLQQQMAELHEHGVHMHELGEEELNRLHEHGIDIRIHLEDELARLQDLGLKLHELGSNEQIIRSAPGGRAFIIERHSDGAPEPRAERRDRSDTQRLRIERDELKRRNHELEDRVEALERKVEALMKKLEER